LKIINIPKRLNIILSKNAKRWKNGMIDCQDDSKVGYNKSRAVPKNPGQPFSLYKLYILINNS